MNNINIAHLSLVSALFWLVLYVLLSWILCRTLDQVNVLMRFASLNT